MSELKEVMNVMQVSGERIPSGYYKKSEADKVIEELKEAQRWRKFSEEKPELGDIVLVKLSERVKGHYFPMDVVRWDSSYELGEIEVSHWMPLPSAPKEEK